MEVSAGDLKSMLLNISRRIEKIDNDPSLTLFHDRRPGFPRCVLPLFRADFELLKASKGDEEVLDALWVYMRSLPDREHHIDALNRTMMGKVEKNRVGGSPGECLHRSFCSF